MHGCAESSGNLESVSIAGQQKRSGMTGLVKTISTIGFARITCGSVVHVIGSTTISSTAKAYRKKREQR